VGPFQARSGGVSGGKSGKGKGENNGEENGGRGVIDTAENGESRGGRPKRSEGNRRGTSGRLGESMFLFQNDRRRKGPQTGGVGGTPKGRREGEEGSRSRAEKALRGACGDVRGGGVGGSKTRKKKKVEPYRNAFAGKVLLRGRVSGKRRKKSKKT